MGKVIEERRKFSDGRFERLRESLIKATEICADKACVYATGSFGRREAGEFSDIDLFIVSLCDGDGKSDRGRLSRLDEILLKAELIRATRELSFPEFSQDGRFLQHHTSRRLIQATGNPNDDAENTFTARLLLLLESRPLAGSGVHSKIIDDVIAIYWREFSGHYDRFMPTYLANDIIRYWRTLCLNYEASTSEQTSRDRAKRKIKNYKLKHSRMLTCYSAILFLLHVYSSNKTVTVSDVQAMVSLTPTERVEFVARKLGDSESSSNIRSFLGLYEHFLDVTSASEEELIKLFSDSADATKYKR